MYPFTYVNLQGVFILHCTCHCFYHRHILFVRDKNTRARIALLTPAGDVEDSVFILPPLVKVEPNVMTKPVLDTSKYGWALISGNNRT